MSRYKYIISVIEDLTRSHTPPKVNRKRCSSSEIRKAEVWKSLGEEGIRLLTEFLNMMMKEEIIPNEWK